MHKHYTAKWRLCRDCGCPAFGCSEFCEDHLDQERDPDIALEDYLERKRERSNEPY